MSKLAQDWMPADDRLKPYYAGIDQFLEQYLKNEKIDEFNSHQSKIIADPLLGYIHFSRLEVAIIDTKLFQRLRKIRQLGLAHLVFPSLGYSRFEHSLGVVGRLNQVVNKLIENNQRVNSDDNISKVIEKYIISLRLAALLHDIGHCLFSHCSERVLEKSSGTETYPAAQLIQQLFTDHFSKEKPIPFAEIFAVSIVGSQKFYEFIDKLGEIPKNQIKHKAEISGRFILGLPSKEDSNTVFLAQLISSGLDADKIDYMNREQHYSGIKLEIDLDRILSKLQVFDLKPSELPRQLESIKELYADDQVIKVLGFGKGGQFAFEEFCVARLALHVKIYLHQKVRAAESQLSRYLELISENTIFQEVHNWLLLPETVVEFPELLLRNFNKNLDLFNSLLPEAFTKVAFRKIDERDIYFRAYAFGPINSYSESFINNRKESSAVINKELENFFEHFNEVNLISLVIEETKHIASITSASIKTEMLNEILIDLPRFINIQQGQESIHFQRPNQIPLKWTIPIDKIVIYFQENRALAYVFAPKEIAHLTCLASEKVIFDTINKVFHQQENISHNTFLKVQDLKKQLTSLGYYDKYPQLKEVSDYLKTAEASDKIRVICENLASFKSLINNERITFNSITTFVNQFPEELQKPCLLFLNELEIYHESLLEEELTKLLDRVSMPSNSIGMTYLGGAGDSGERFNYYVRNAIEKFNLNQPRLINDTLINNSDILIIYDDNINSGMQLLNIFAELLGIEDKLPEELKLNEKHVTPLSTEEAKKRLRKLPIYFVFIVGYSGIDRKIKSLFEEYLDINPDNINLIISKYFYNDKKIFSGANSTFQHADKLKLKQFLEKTGEELLRAEKKKEGKIKSCKLGYANAEAMVLFPYNIPTMTITALWCRGKINDIPWIPLAERRRRTTKDGHYIGED